MLKFNKKNESGRSMVEMLGVLAIIGVLSIGGIAGYTAAMKSYKENEIVASTSMCYMMGMAQNGGTGKVAMTYTPAPTGTSSIAFGIDNKVTITFSDTNLCAGVKAKFGDNAGDCSGNTLVVTLGDEEEETQPTVTEGEACSSEDEAKTVCVNGTQYQCVHNPDPGEPQYLWHDLENPC